MYSYITLLLRLLFHLYNYIKLYSRESSSFYKEYIAASLLRSCHISFKAQTVTLQCYNFLFNWNCYIQYVLYTTFILFNRKL